MLSRKKGNRMNSTGRKQLKKFAMVISILCLLAIGISNILTSNVLDYSDPRFEYSKFSFKNYPSLISMRDFLYDVCVPEDANIATLDEIFVKYGGARKKVLRRSNRSDYSSMYFFPPSAPKKHPPKGQVEYVIEALVSESGRVLDCDVNDFTLTPTVLSAETGAIPRLRKEIKEGE
jgi:hypothetical protein